MQSSSDGSRWIELAGASNVRDLGGLPTVDGATTRRGVVVRSDGVHELTADDVAKLTDEIGVRHVIDLRTPGERTQTGRGLLGARDIVYSELAIIDDELIEQRRVAREAAMARPGADPAVVLAEGYQQLLEVGADRFVTAIERIVAPGGAPALFHCSAGKDRTGVLAALLLELARVEREVVVADYAATETRIEEVRARLAVLPSFAHAAAEATGMSMSSPARTMSMLLDWLDTTAGGAEAWFLASGGSPATLTAWRQQFLD